jgi:uncharacterized protein
MEIIRDDTDTRHRARLLTPVLTKWFFRGKVLVLTGARQVGKSTLVENLAALSGERTLLLNADFAHVRKMLKDPDLPGLTNIIGKNRLVIIDEVQRIENPGLFLKILADHFKKVQFIATGSSALDIADRVFEPLTGRHFLFHLYPFSLKELYPDPAPLEVEGNLPFHLIYGMYPDVCNNRADARTILGNLANQYLYKDVLAWKEIRKPDLLDKLLELLAWQACKEVSLHELATQLGVKTATIDSYIDVLEKSFVVFRLSSYASNARKEVSKLKKIVFWDNGIRNALTGNFDAPSNRADAGVLWENFMISERVKMNHYLQRNAQPFFWRSLQQQEVDYVETEKKKISGYEMKYARHERKYVTKGFTNIYGNAQTMIVDDNTFRDFCFLSRA